MKAWQTPTPLALAAVLLCSLLLLPPAAQAQSAAGRLLVDDFEDGDLEATSGLSWVAFSDDQFGGSSEARIEVVDGGAAGSRRGLRFSGRTGGETERKIAAVWVPIAAEGLPKDLSGYDGIRFFARGDGQSFRAGLRRGIQRLSNYTYAFTAPKEWTRIEIPYGELAKNPQGATTADWTPEDISWVGFSVPMDYLGPFVLEIDQVEFYHRPQPRSAATEADTTQGGEAR